MTILIDNRSNTPIYEQIFTQIRQQILSGELPEGMALPSIRGLAKDLRISVITTKRAYEELETAGFINTVPGKGSFVAPRNLELVREENLRRIEGYMTEIWTLARMCGLEFDDLAELLMLLGREEEL